MRSGTRVALRALLAGSSLLASGCSSNSSQDVSQGAGDGGGVGAGDGGNGSTGGGGNRDGGDAGGSSGAGEAGVDGAPGGDDSGVSTGDGSMTGDGGPSTYNPPYPHLGAYPIGGPQNYGSSTFISVAAKCHVVIVSNWQGFSNGGMSMAQIFGAIKSQSTVGTKLFSYINNNETETWNEQAILTKVSAQPWYLYPSGLSGTPVPSSYSGATEVNNTTFTHPDSTGKNWIQWYDDFRYAAFVTGDSLDSANPYGDGFFMDNVFWSPRVDGDWNLDGTSDSQNDPTVQGWYRAGYQQHTQYIRSIWPGSLQLGNIADWGQTNATLGVYDLMLNGGVLEGMIGDSWSFETFAGFDGMMLAYQKMMDALAPPKLGVFGDDGDATDYQGMRYGLGATLMDDAYYYHSNGGDYAPPPLWFDEYDSSLGYPLSSAQGARQTGPWLQGVWRRDFDNGIVLVNPKGNGSQTVNLGGTFTKLTGAQAPAVNDGATVSSVTLSDRDGIILRR